MADRSSVVPQLLGAAVGIVLGSVLLFAVVGVLRDDGPTTPEVVAEPSPSATAEPAEGDEAEPSPDPATEAETETEAEPEPEPEPSPTAEPAAEPSPEPAEPSEPAQEVDPSEVSIQVLNAAGGGQGGEAAQQVADELREAGFDVVVVNRASTSYDVTTVFWTSGQAAGGQQVATTVDAARAEETPDEVRLSDSVDVHVIVGTDRT